MPPPCGHPGYQPSCRLCVLYTTRADYRALWDRTPTRPVPRSRDFCLHRGPATGSLVDCPTCAGKVSLKLFACSLHGRCTLEKSVPEFACCRDCPDHTERIATELTGVGGALPETEKLRRNLLYHVYPVQGNGVWQWNVDELCRRLDLFNGRVVVAVALDPATGRKPDPTGPWSPDTGRHLGACASLEEVRARFGRHAERIEFIAVENDPALREVATFLPLFSRVESTDPCEVTLYAHAKGSTRHAGHTARRWTEILFEVFLDHWPLVEAQLRLWPVTGCFMKLGPGWSRTQTDSDWHYSGSWFAFRNASLFSQPDWRRIDQFWSGIEPYPSQHWRHHECGVLFCRGQVPAVNLYSQDYLRRTVEPHLRRWKQVNGKWRNNAPGSDGLAAHFSQRGCGGTSCC